MDSNPYNQMSNFVDLLESQQHTVFGYVQGSVELCSSQVPLFFTQSTEASIPTQDTSVESIQRRKWTPIDDVVLISTWLNTSKNHVVGNEQRSGAFWKRIAAYFAASPKELRNDQKWCEFSTSKTEGSAKKRKCDESAQSSTSHATETTTGENKEGTIHPPGIKASKGHGKKKMASDGKDGKSLSEYQSMWNINMQDLAIKEKLSKMKLLDSLLAKTESLLDYEEALKKKLITDLLSN
uniref:No apical meristem-associated C-terminal domain-containing protein n=1 Tax=Brassica oleracea var. oleracea TaxID=109376 RepID=A0A0D3CK84_BRAOL